MNIQNMTKYAVGLLVGLVMVAGLIIPIVNGATSPTLTYENEGVVYSTPDESEHTLEVAVDDGKTVLTFDGVSMEPAEYDVYSLVVGESSFIRLNPSTGALAIARSNIISNVIAPSTIILNGSTATVGNVVLSDVLAYQAPSGDLRLSSNPCVISDTEIFGAGQSYYTQSVVPGTLNYWQTFHGTIEGIDATKVATIPPTTNVSYGDIAVNTTKVGSELVRVDSIIFNVTVDTGSADPIDLALSYTYFIAPAIIEYDNPGYSEMGSGLLGIIPLMAILVLVVYAAYYMRNRA